MQGEREPLAVSASVFLKRASTRKELLVRLARSEYGQPCASGEREKDPPAVQRGEPPGL
jgi:hypothetical protein